MLLAPLLIVILTTVYVLIEDCLVLFMAEVWRQVAHEERHVGAVRVLFQLQVEPGQLLVTGKSRG